MNAERIESIQKSGYQAAIVISGGGSGAVQALLSHPGASRFVLDVRIPYSRKAMNEYLGCAPASYCSEETAGRLADEAFRCATKSAGRVLAISCTAALKTRGERADPDRAFICFHSAEKRRMCVVRFTSETRSEQEAELSRILIEKLADFVAE